MDLFYTALEEIALEGLEGVTISGLWNCFEKRQPPYKGAIDHWTKPHVWKSLATSEFVQFFLVNFDGEKKEDVPVNKAERLPKMGKFWLYDYRDGTAGYSPSFYYRDSIAKEIRDENNKCLIQLDEAIEKWGENLWMVAAQDYRRRVLFGPNNPPIIEEVTPVRYIILEIVAKKRWEGFMQADFQKLYGVDPRTSFHHIKLLIKLRLLTKQNVLISHPVNNEPNPIPPKSSKMLHLSQYSNVYTNNLQKAAAKICHILAEASDAMMERNALRQMCSDIPQFKKIRQWLFQTGYIHYVVNGQIWTADNMNPVQISHFRACRPCYVNLVRKFQLTDVDDDRDDDFLDYIENCDDIEPQIIYEETLHHQAYRVIIACREKGITMKKLAEVMCIPYAMARSFIRYFDTNKIGRIVTIDHLKLKVQKIVAIQFLHESETVQQIKSQKTKIEQHKAEIHDIKPAIKEELKLDQSLAEKNLELADDIGFTRVSEKCKVSLRHLARKNYVIDTLKEQAVFEGHNEMYKSLIYHEESRRSTQGVCCRKTFKRILDALHEEGQIRKYTCVIDDSSVPPTLSTFFCAAHITETSPEYEDAIDVARVKRKNREKRREIKQAMKDTTKVKVKTKSDEAHESPIKIKLDFKEEDNDLTDTDDEDFKKSQGLSTARNMQNRFFTFGRFQKLHVFHLYLWKLVYGTEQDIEDLKAVIGPSREFIDLVQSRHIWLEGVSGLPEYKEGPGWFNVGDIISLMPLEVTCRVLGIKCWSETAIKYLEDSKKRLLTMNELPPRLKYKLLVSPANKYHLDNTVELLVLMSQMGLVAVSPMYYPKIRTEIMLFLRKEAIIVDTRFTEKAYCHTQLPRGMDAFPESVYKFSSLSDVERYWTDLQFVCLNTPLGLNRVERHIASQPLSAEDEMQGKGGLNKFVSKAVPGRVYRSFTILRDFQPFYEGKDFPTMEPVVFGNGLGAGGLDSTFFGHLAKNWRYGKKAPANRVRIDIDSVNESGGSNENSNDGSILNNESMKDEKTCKGRKIKVSGLLVQNRKGGKGLKRKLSSTTGVMTKKMKIERKKQFDKLIAKRFEHVREKVRATEIKRKAMRKGKKTLYAMNHDDKDREALRRMKGMRVSFTEREDAFILLVDIVKTMMKLYEKGQPLEREHPKVFWHVVRDEIHKDVPESRDKTWNAIERRARYIKKYPHSLIVFKTCVAELEQDQEFLESLICTKENWKQKMLDAFKATRDIYSRHFNQQVDFKDFPTSLNELHNLYQLDFAHIDKPMKEKFELKSEKDVRISILQDLMHNSLTAQKLSSYIPAVAFKVFDAYPPDELKEAFEFYRENKLISRYRVDVPRRRSLPISTMTYNLSTTYFRLFEPSMPLRIFQMARSLYVQMRDGKPHANVGKEQEIAKQSSVAPQGTCELNFTNIQGGHVAYLLSAIVNNKVHLNYLMPDEITINDEAHLKRLKEGNLNFQRVAFEQRLKRGEILVQKKSMEVTEAAMSRSNSEEGVDDSEGNVKADVGELGHKMQIDSTKDRTDSNDDSRQDSPALMNKQSISTDHPVLTDKRTVTAGDAYASKSVSPKEKVTPCSTDPSVPKDPILKHTEIERNENTPSPSIIAMDVDSTLPPQDTEENVSLCKDSDTGVSRRDEARPEANEAGPSKDTDTSVKASTLSEVTERSSAAKKRVKRIALKRKQKTEQKGSHACFVMSLSNQSSALSCYFGRSDISKATYDIIPKNVKLQNEFVYTTQSSSKKSKILSEKLNLFKDGKFHASRTALSMQRSIGNEKLIPTNAMNTYDALVMNPMKIASHLLTSPFRSFVKPKPSNSEMEIWQRFREQSGDDSYCGNGLTVDEYCELLRCELNMKEELIDAHRIIVERVKKAYILGIKMEDVKNVFSDVCSEFMDEWEEHLQTLLNFKMLYKVGHYDERIVDSLYFSCWCFRAPQVVSNFESPNKLDKKTTNADKDVDADADTKDANGKGTDAETSTSSSSSNVEASHEEGGTGKGSNEQVDDQQSSCSVGAKETEEHDAPGPAVNYKVVKVRPWLKLDGQLNGVLLKRFQEILLVYIMMNPGAVESQIMDHFKLILKPIAAKMILNFLVLNGSISKHVQQQKKSTLFSSITSGSSPGESVVYYLPATLSLLNMMDINR